MWNRPRIGHKGPVRRSTPIDEIPFLAVARSLGDLWSYNSQLDEFVVSPEPDCSVIPINTNGFRCLIFGTDGLYNMLSPQMAVHIVQQAERHNEDAALSDAPQKVWLNPSKCLVEEALERWSTTKMRADNTTVVTVMLDPPGPPRAQVLKNRKRNYSDSGLQIVTRYENQAESERELIQTREPIEIGPNEIINATIIDPIPSCSDTNMLDSSESCTNARNVNSQDDNAKSEISCSSQVATKNVPETFDRNFIPRPRESLAFDPSSTSNVLSSNCSYVVDQTELESNVTNSDITRNEENIQINEISSSSMEIDYKKKRGNVEYTKLRLTKRKSIGKTKRILNSSENFRHLKVSQTETAIVSTKEDIITNSKVLLDSNATSSISSALNVEASKKKLKDKNTNRQSLIMEKESSIESKVVTRSKTSFSISKTNISRSYTDETSKENNTPKHEETRRTNNKNVTLTNLPKKETRLTRKRALEISDVLPMKKPRVQVISKPVVVKKNTRQSVLNLLKPIKDETNKNVQTGKIKNNNLKLNNNNGEKTNKQKTMPSTQRTSRKSSNILNLQFTRTRSSVEKKLPKSNETKKLDSSKKNIIKEHKLFNIKTRSNIKNDHSHHLRRSRK